MFERLSRRGILAGGFAAAAKLACPSMLGDPQPRDKGLGPRSMRLVHMTDVHLTANGDATQKFARCMDKIHHQERPDLVIQGGDIVMEGLMLDRATVQSQYALAASLMSRHLTAPMVHCLGNHDVWGWNRPDVPAISGDPLFGKGMWLDWTGYPKTYYSFDRAGWHFIVLDSIHPKRAGGNYIACLDRGQWQWLEDDISRVPATTNVCIVSHAPFLHGGAQFFERSEHSSAWHVSASLLHIDGRRFKDLLAHHPNIRLCLSGHIHMFSRVHYNGASHVSSGAVSGCWWKGDMQETHPGYVVVDLYTDGKVRSRFETY